MVVQVCSTREDERGRHLELGPEHHLQVRRVLRRLVDLVLVAFVFHLELERESAPWRDDQHVSVDAHPFRALDAQFERHLPAGAIDTAFGQVGKQSPHDLARIGERMQQAACIVQVAPYAAAPPLKVGKPFSLARRAEILDQPVPTTVVSEPLVRESLPNEPIPTVALIVVAQVANKRVRVEQLVHLLAIDAQLARNLTRGHTLTRANERVGLAAKNVVGSHNVPRKPTPRLSPIAALTRAHFTGTPFWSETTPRGYPFAKPAGKRDLAHPSAMRTATNPATRPVSLRALARSPP